MAEDAKSLIELATRRFLSEVPALEPIKLVVGVELRGRGDVQHFRLEMPGVKVAKGPATDARVRVDMRREFFNVMAREGKVAETKEISAGTAFADFSEDGSLLGIELLAPCPLEILEDVSEKESEQVRQFLRRGVRKEMIFA